jgi:hypothetical protein
MERDGARRDAPRPGEARFLDSLRSLGMTMELRSLGMTMGLRSLGMTMELRSLGMTVRAPRT